MPTDTQMLTLSEIQEEVRALRVQLSSMAISDYERNVLERRLTEMTSEFRRRTR